MKHEICESDKCPKCGQLGNFIVSIDINGGVNRKTMIKDAIKNRKFECETCGTFLYRAANCPSCGKPGYLIAHQINDKVKSNHFVCRKCGTFSILGRAI